MSDQDSDQSTSLDSNPFMGALQGMAQPQQQVPQQAPQQQQDPNQTQPIFQGQNNPTLDEHKGYVKNTLDDLNSFNKQTSPQIQKLLNKLNYTPEMRTKDLYAQIVGQKPLVGPQQEDQPTQYQPLTFKRKVGNYLKEIALGAAQGANKYQSPMERAHARALEDYKAEGSTAGPELRSLTTEQTRLQGIAGQAIRGLQGAQINQQKADTLQQRADIEQGKLTARNKLDVFRSSQMEANTEKIRLEQGEIAAKTYLDKINGAKSQQELDHRLKYGLPSNASEAAIEDKLIQDGDYAGAEKRAKLRGMGSFGGIPRFTIVQGPQGPVKVQTGGLGAENAEAKPINAPTMPLQLTNVPPGVDPSKVSQIPFQKMAAGDDSRFLGALQTYDHAQKMKAALNKIPDSEIGTLAGRLARTSVSDLENGTADPTVMRFYNEAGIMGAGHTVAQNFRNAQFAESIQKAASRMGTNKAAIWEAIDSFEGTGRDTMRTMGQYGDAHVKFSNYTKDFGENEKIFDPESYEKRTGKKINENPYQSATTPKRITGANIDEWLKK